MTRPPPAPRTGAVITDLCGRYLDVQQDSGLLHQPAPPSAAATAQAATTMPVGGPWPAEQPVGESPQTQIHSVFSMMWPNVPPLEAADVVMGEDAAWMEFLRAGSAEDWGGPLERDR
ncbi:hypothetical protein VTK73DRAFT_3064 [Phialemonium thermophilum]|uniref:Uncharacterized protein n=1 Tax=Phialemonium thermophilum TaxID=223376 RepID=A0ABR3VLD0_9PEZI